MNIKHWLRGTAASAIVFAACTPVHALDPSYSGSWYNPSESGSGFNLEIFDDDSALLFWYTYDDAGDAVWLYSEGAISGDTIEFDTYFAQGMRFSDLDAADKDNRFWGSVTMTFQDCNNATIQYQSTLTGLDHSPVGSRTLEVDRLVNIASLPCRQQAAGYWKGEHFDPTLGGGAGAWADLSGVLTEDGRLFFRSDASGEVFIGTFQTDGADVVFDYRICENGGGPANCVDATGTSTFGSRDFVHGDGTTTQWGTNPFNLHYSTVYDRTPTLASLAGTWGLTEDGVTYTISISGSGLVTGSDDRGCTYNGQLTPVDAKFNAFSFEGTLGTCTADGWSGMVVNTDAVDAGDRDALEFYVQGDTGFYGFTLTRL